MCESKQRGKGTHAQSVLALHCLFLLSSHPRSVLFLQQGKAHTRDATFTASALSKLACKSSLRQPSAYRSEFYNKCPSRVRKEQLPNAQEPRHSASWPSQYRIWFLDSSLTCLLKYHQAQLPDCWNTKIKLLKRNPSTLEIF